MLITLPEMSEICFLCQINTYCEQLRNWVTNDIYSHLGIKVFTCSVCSSTFSETNFPVWKQKGALVVSSPTTSKLADTSDVEKNNKMVEQQSKSKPQDSSQELQKQTQDCLLWWPENKGLVLPVPSLSEQPPLQLNRISQNYHYSIWRAGWCKR